MMNIILSKSPRNDKKLRVNIDGKNIDFGAEGYSDYIINKSDVKRNAYIARHRVREDWNNPYTAGFWSRWLLWEKTDLIDAIHSLEKRFNINIKY